jgi:hypothetical protein
MGKEVISPEIAGIWAFVFGIRSVKQAGIARNIGTRNLSNSEPLSKFLNVRVQPECKHSTDTPSQNASSCSQTYS